MSTTKKFTQVTAVTVIIYSILLERSTPRICFLNALRLVKFLSSLLTFDQMKGPSYTVA